MAFTWDEPAGAATPRGWLRNEGCVGFYLDYGPDLYRSPHKYCSPNHLCRECQPGNILVCRYPNGSGESPHESRWVETIGQARHWVESGNLPELEGAKR